jgi:hypothetical protein
VPRPDPRELRPGEEEVALCDAVGFILDECRMVLPGIQTLFGFQLIAVFSDRFGDLSRLDQVLHFVAITLVVVAIALIMTPAACHRHMGVRHVSESFIRLSTWLLLASMGPLAFGIAIDFYIIGRLVLGAEAAILPLTLALVGLFGFLWVFVPRSRALQGRLAAPTPRAT